jgi:hypothetical protein
LPNVLHSPGLTGGDIPGDAVGQGGGGGGGGGGGATPVLLLLRLLPVQALQHDARAVVVATNTRTVGRTESNRKKESLRRGQTALDTFDASQCRAFCVLRKRCLVEGIYFPSGSETKAPSPA